MIIDSPYSLADQAELNEAGQKLEIAKLEFYSNRPKALHLVAEWLLALHHCRTDPVSGRLYVYDRLDGFYRVTGEEMLRSDMVSALGALITKHGMAEVLAKVRALSYRELDQLEATTPPNLIPLKNGVYDLNFGALRPHSPERFFTYVHPITYDPNATCPAIDTFISEIVATITDRELLLDIASCLFYRARVTRHFYVLVGDGHNGKTVYLSILQAILGKGRYVAVTPQALAKDVFAPSQLYDKHANLGGDIPGGNIEDASVIKNVTGGDPVSVQRKGVDRVDIFPYCELVYSSNDPPRITEDTYAIWDRLVAISFPYTFKKNPQGPNEKPAKPKEALYAELLSSKELSGLFNQICKRLPTLVANGKLSANIEPQETRRQYRAISDSLAVFIEEACEEVEYISGDTYGPATGYETADIAYRYYRDWCLERQLRPVSARVFGKEIEETHGFQKGKEQSGKIRSYRGLRIKRGEGQGGQEGHLTLYACSNKEKLKEDYSESVLPVLPIPGSSAKHLVVLTTSPVAFEVLLDQCAELKPSLSRDTISLWLTDRLAKLKVAGDVYEPRPGFYASTGGEAML